MTYALVTPPRSSERDMRVLTSSTAQASFWSVCVDSGFCFHTCNLSYVNLSL